MTLERLEDWLADHPELLVDVENALDLEAALLDAGIAVDLIHQFSDDQFGNMINNVLEIKEDVLASGEQSQLEEEIKAVEEVSQQIQAIEESKPSISKTAEALRSITNTVKSAIGRFFRRR